MRLFGVVNTWSLRRSSAPPTCGPTIDWQVGWFLHLKLCEVSVQGIPSLLTVWIITRRSRKLSLTGPTTYCAFIYLRMICGSWNWCLRSGCWVPPQATASSNNPQFQAPRINKQVESVLLSLIEKDIPEGRKDLRNGHENLAYSLW